MDLGETTANAMGSRPHHHLHLRLAEIRLGRLVSFLDSLIRASLFGGPQIRKSSLNATIGTGRHGAISKKASAAFNVFVKNTHRKAQSIDQTDVKGLNQIESTSSNRDLVSKESRSHGSHLIPYLLICPFLSPKCE
ncbi:unnamed protein product [Protopolystoma xenopodis]|uniref:Uncharacterized protein n=1 Tax=Protopolystoma xenopodis TaxID=117903 RepID=A0A3S5AHI1_9PLAT|nr:unnamed protein product [Protopolystoma xenopodis]